ncbi:MAG: hypothetical protein ABFS43_00750 [Thermodesulfobacteriota bacterium]
MNESDKTAVPKKKASAETICPYKSGIIGGRPRIESRTKLTGRIVAVLTSKRDQRGLKLIHPYTRCIKKNEIHEFLMTDEIEALPGATVNRVSAIAFIEFTEGGVIMERDAVHVRGKEIGKIAGFDESHFPNHMNILLKGPERKTGLEHGIEGGDSVEFIQGQNVD